MRTKVARSSNSFDRAAADITHGSLQATGQLVQDAGDRTLIGNLTFDTFRNELQRVAHFRPK